MARDEVFEVGIWCTSCQFFETEDMESVDEDNACVSCGCPMEQHRNAQVVPNVQR